MDAVQHDHSSFSKPTRPKSQLKDTSRRQILSTSDRPAELEMLRMLSSLKVLLAANAPYEPGKESDTQRWLTDPLSHPVLDTMTERELGDVPFRLTARRTVHETTPLHASFGGRC
ncbi:hypothetical protein ACVDG5_002045 [Mesorhizobium sp. ORM6]